MVYETLSRGIAEDAGLLGMLMRTPDEQRRPSLLFAAVNALLATRPDAALTAYYPVHGGRRPVDGRLLTEFAAFCAEYEDELGALLRTRSTQTNEIRRCAALRLGLGHVHQRWPGPLALAEVGASAGLNLLFDRYGYRVGDHDIAPAPDSRVVISCELRGDDTLGTPFGRLAEITSRIGIDQRPIRLQDKAERAWLEAFIWPEDVDGLATLRAAIEQAVATSAATVVAGDATTDTARLIGGLPGEEPVVVFTASLLSYLGADARTEFIGQLDEVARDRPVAWVFAESPGLVATTGLCPAALQGPLAGRNGLYLVGASLRYPNRHDDSVLALADPYLRWLAPARMPADDFRWLSD